MAKTRRSSVDNMFAKKGSVQPQKKDVSKEEPVEQNHSIEETKEVGTTEKEDVIEEVKVTEEQKVEESIKEKPVKKQVKKNRSSNIDGLFGKKKQNGKSQSVYLKKEVYDFCNGIAEDYQIGMSDVINKLILSIMEENEE